MTKEEMQDEIGLILCNKNKNISCDKCFQDRTKGICEGFVHCRVSEKTEEQLEYVLSSISENIFLRACAGSGKTEVVGMKAAYEIKKWNKQLTSGIAILSFTNDAVQVIKDRIRQFNGNSSTYPHFVGTLSSFVHQYIAQPYIYKYCNYVGKNNDMSFSIVEDNMKIYDNHWMTGFKCEIPFISVANKRTDLYAHQIMYNKKDCKFYFIIGSKFICLEDYYNSTQMQKYIENNREKYNNPKYYSFKYVKDKFAQCKIKFWKNGFANFDDMNLLAYNVLDKNDKAAKVLSKKFPLIIIDECQDLSWIEVQILNKLKQYGSKLHFIGDLNQSVFEFKKVDPDDTIKFIKQFNKMELCDNFRSCSEIVELSKKLMPSMGKVLAHGESKCSGNALLYMEYKDEHDVIDKYIEILDKLKISREKSCVIVKQNKMKDLLLSINENNDIDLFISAIQLWNKQNVYQKLKAFELAGRQISKWLGGSKSKLDYYCPKDITSIFSWRIFLMGILNDCCKNAKLLNFDQSYGEWHMDARCILPDIIKYRYEKLKKNDTVKERDLDTIFSGHWFNAKNSREKIALILDEQYNTKIHVTTIHGSKGCTYDSTLVVSSKSVKSEEGHWKAHWINGMGEAKRVGYVASTRAKYLLVWAVPKLSIEEQNLIKSYGFKDVEKILI